MRAMVAPGREMDPDRRRGVYDLTRTIRCVRLDDVCKKGSQIVRIGTVHTGQRSETIHRANLSAILRVLHEHGPRSRSELVAATGLTRSAIRDLVHELAAAGLVSEGDAVRLGTPGRPSPLVRPEPTGAVVLAFEVLVGSMAAAVVGLGGRTSTASASKDRSTTFRGRRRGPARPPGRGPAHSLDGLDRRCRGGGRRGRPTVRRPRVHGPEPRLGGRAVRRPTGSSARPRPSHHGPHRRRCRDACRASARRGHRRGRRALCLGRGGRRWRRIVAASR